MTATRYPRSNALSLRLIRTTLLGAITLVVSVLNGKPYIPPAQPRWSADLDFLCAVYDTWRRMELIRRAAGHIRRKGFQSNVKLVCAADASVLQQTFQCLGENASLKGALQSPDVPACLKTALADLLLFSSEVQSAGG